MESLIDQLVKELGISESEAVEIIQTIAEYVENQHPVLSGIAESIARIELEKSKIT